MRYQVRWLVETSVYHYHWERGETLAISLSYCLSYSCMEGQQQPAINILQSGPHITRYKTIPTRWTSTTSSSMSKLVKWGAGCFSQSAPHWVHLHCIPAPIPSLLVSFCDGVPLCCLGNYNHNYRRTRILLLSFNEAIPSYLLLALILWTNVEIKTYAHN